MRHNELESLFQFDFQNDNIQVGDIVIFKIVLVYWKQTNNKYYDIHIKAILSHYFIRPRIFIAQA